MEIYQCMDEAIHSKDLLYCGQKLIEFADTAYREKNRATLLKHFYQRLYEWTFLEYAFDNSPKQYYICDSAKAIGMYLALAIPKADSPVKSLKKIKSFGELILANYTKPIGKALSKASLENILQFLDDQYEFTSKVFTKQKSAFLLMPYSHRYFNSECQIINTNSGTVQHFFLYHMRVKGENAPNPEAVLFHELGHAIHASCVEDVHQIPVEMIDLLQKLCFPKLNQISATEQCEVFADVLSMGLMYQTPFEKYDLFQQIHPDDKAAFKSIVENLIGK